MTRITDAPIIDGHVHMWPEPRPGDRIAEPPGFPLPRGFDASAEPLIANMDAFGVSRAVVVQTPWHYFDDGYMREMAERYPGRLSLVGSFPLWLAEADIARETARLGQDGLQGVRVHVAGDGAMALFAGEAVDPLYRRAADLRLPILFLTRNYQAFPIYGQIAARFPDMPMVVEHMGHATPPFGATPADEDALMELSAHPNVHIKIGLHHQHTQGDYPWIDLHPLQRRFLDEFGAQRLFWGSNWPMREPTYAQRLEVLSRHFPFKDEEERAWVLGCTALSLWQEPS